MIEPKGIGDRALWLYFWIPDHFFGAIPAFWTRMRLHDHLFLAATAVGDQSGTCCLERPQLQHDSLVGPWKHYLKTADDSMQCSRIIPSQFPLIQKGNKRVCKQIFLTLWIQGLGDVTLLSVQAILSLRCWPWCFSKSDIATPKVSPLLVDGYIIHAWATILFEIIESWGLILGSKIVAALVDFL